MMATELRPGLLGKATDRELTVHFVAPSPNVTLRTNHSIHPQLKPNFTGEFTGYLLVATTAQYTLSGAPEVFVDGRNIADRPATLPAGERRLRIPITRARGEPFSIHLSWRMNEAPAVTVSPSALAHERPPRELAENQIRDLGRQLFEDFNCAACHRAETPLIRFTTLTNAVSAPPLRALRPTNGCLADEPDENVPRFSLNEQQREALQLFIQTPDISPAPLQDFPRLLTQLDCRSCHDSFKTAAASEFEAALVSHQEKLIVTNVAAADFRRLVDLFASQVATNRPSP